VRRPTEAGTTPGRSVAGALARRKQGLQPRSNVYQSAASVYRAAKSTHQRLEQPEGVLSKRIVQDRRDAKGLPDGIA